MGVGDQHFLDRHFLVAARTGAVHHAQVGLSALGIHAWQGLAFVSLGRSGGMVFGERGQRKTVRRP